MKIYGEGRRESNKLMPSVLFPSKAPTPLPYFPLHSSAFVSLLLSPFLSPFFLLLFHLFIFTSSFPYLPPHEAFCFPSPLHSSRLPSSIHSLYSLSIPLISLSFSRSLQFFSFPSSQQTFPPGPPLPSPLSFLPYDP